MALTLRPLQQAGVRWLRARRRALLLDEPGCGKTAQVLRALPAGAATLVVCPANALYVWRDECARWRPDLRPEVLRVFRWPAPGEVLAVNYERLPWEYAPAPAALVLTCDEAHRMTSAAPTLRDTTTQVGVKLHALFARARQVDARQWALTGTPLKNHPGELWNLLCLLGLEREAFGCHRHFVSAFSGWRNPRSRDPRTDWEWGVPRPAAEAGLRKVALRRTLEEMMGGTVPPPRWRTWVVPCPPDARTALDRLEALLGVEGSWLVQEAAWTAGAARVPFEEVSRCASACAAAKVPAMLEYVAAREAAGVPILVFSSHRLPIEVLSRRADWGVIWGGTPPKRRKQVEREFQAGRLRGVALTIRAGSEALTLTRAQEVLRVGRDWTPARNTQAEDRAVRFGQARSVLITDLTLDHPLELQLACAIARKRVVIDGAGLG